MRMGLNRKDLDFFINLYNEPEAVEALRAFFKWWNTNALTVEESDIATSAMAPAANKIVTLNMAFNFLASRGFYIAEPPGGRDLAFFFAMGALTHRFYAKNACSNKVFIQALASSMPANYLFFYNLELINSADTQLLNAAAKFSLALFLGFCSLATSYMFLRLFLAAETIGSTTPLHRAVINDDKPKFEALLFKGANMYKLDNSNKRLDELQPENATINLQTHGYKRLAHN